MDIVAEVVDVDGSFDETEQAVVLVPDVEVCVPAVGRVRSERPKETAPAGFPYILRPTTRAGPTWVL